MTLVYTHFRKWNCIEGNCVLTFSTDGYNDPSECRKSCNNSNLNQALLNNEIELENMQRNRYNWWFPRGWGWRRRRWW